MSYRICVLLIATIILMGEWTAPVSAADTSSATAEEKAYDTLNKYISKSMQKAYEKAFEGKEEDMTGPTERIWAVLFYALDVLAGIYKFAIVASVSVGVIVFLLASKNKRIKKFALYFLIIALPVILTVFRYGIPCLYPGTGV